MFRPTCSARHEGRQLLHQIIPLDVDQVFTILFTSSQFLLNLYTKVNITHVNEIQPWTNTLINNTKCRIISYDVPMNQYFLRKTVRITEKQVLLSCSKAGSLYAVDIEAVNVGFLYDDCFLNLIHYCIEKISNTSSSVFVFTQTQFVHHVPAAMKAIINKKCKDRLERYFVSLDNALHEYATRKQKKKGKLSNAAPIRDNR